MQRWLWSQVSDIGPSARYGHRMVYDPMRDRVLLFGGTVRGPTGVADEETQPSDTWEWDSESWTQVEDIGPPGRSQYGLAYDTKRNRVVLFGGWSKTGSFNDTWEWDGQVWTQVGDDGPPPTLGITMAYEKHFGYCLMCYEDSTWAWDGNLWTQLSDARIKRGVTAYDDAEEYMILGADAPQNGNTPIPEPSPTWRWDGRTWNVVSDIGPSYLYDDACMAFDGKRFILYQTMERETWEWDGVHWTQRQDMGPSERSGSALVGDTSRRHCVLFGGFTQAPFVGDTWILSVG